MRARCSATLAVATAVVSSILSLFASANSYQTLCELSRGNCSSGDIDYGAPLCLGLNHADCGGSNTQCSDTDPAPQWVCITQWSALEFTCNYTTSDPCGTQVGVVCVWDPTSGLYGACTATQPSPTSYICSVMPCTN